ncbi:MAG: hypothetical protein IJW63_07730 [Lachnospiraceae bacterium]|nr:hypothetical protein [Lachnospiraceae bacterium]
MSDREILELLLEKVSSVESKVTSLDGKVTSLDGKVTSNENSIANLDRQLKKSVAELKAMDELILDEVERVHAILDKHKEDKNVHSA